MIIFLCIRKFYCLITIATSRSQNDNLSCPRLLCDRFTRISSSLGSSLALDLSLDSTEDLAGELCIDFFFALLFKVDFFFFNYKNFFCHTIEEVSSDLHYILDKPYEHAQQDRSKSWLRCLEEECYRSKENILKKQKDTKVTVKVQQIVYDVVSFAK